MFQLPPWPRPREHLCTHTQNALTHLQVPRAAPHSSISSSPKSRRLNDLRWVWRAPGCNPLGAGARSCPPADPWPRGQGLCPASSTQRRAGTDSGHRPSGRKGKWTARSHWHKAASNCSWRTQPELLGQVPGPGSTLPAAPAASASFLACRPQVSAGEALSAASCWEALSSCTRSDLPVSAGTVSADPIFSRTL